MTGSFTAIWRIEPTTSPRPYRHCATCGGGRAFVSSGRIRLNANGQRLDAWLIYKCQVCERTWNLALMERVAVALVPVVDLQAMQDSDPSWVRRQEFDLPRLRRYCDRIEVSEVAKVQRVVQGHPPDGVSVVVLRLEVPFATGERLDRLLARELGLSRSALQAMVGAGSLALDAGAERALRKPVVTGVTLRFLMDRMVEDQRDKVVQGVLGGGNRE